MSKKTLPNKAPKLQKPPEIKSGVNIIPKGYKKPIFPLENVMPVDTWAFGSDPIEHQKDEHKRMNP